MNEKWMPKMLAMYDIINDHLDSGNCGCFLKEELERYAERIDHILYNTSMLDNSLMTEFSVVYKEWKKEIDPLIEGYKQEAMDMNKKMKSSIAHSLKGKVPHPMNYYKIKRK